MSEDFDPYHKWLGIAPKDQPPHHYRLLGIDLFEDDRDVIDAAANRVMAYLKDLATGDEAAHTQKLLNEVAKARVCLLNPEKKEEYDRELRKKLGPKKPPSRAKRKGSRQRCSGCGASVNIPHQAGARRFSLDILSIAQTL